MNKLSTINYIKLLWCIGLFFIIGMYGIGSNADYAGYISSLENIGVSKSITQEKKILYRNDVVRLLSTIQCNDCIHPDKITKEQYSGTRWQKFITLPGNNFDDVLWENYIWKGEDYYYCIAQAAEKGIVNGYPRDISPFCPGKFCGVNLVKQGELIQIIFNIKKNNPQNSYSIDRSTVKQWLSDKKTSAIAQKNFTIDDRALIEKKYKECGTTNCSIHNGEELDVYAKFCTWNISACHMVEFDYASEGQWPVAELNILIQEGILNVIQADLIKPYDVADSKQLLEYLYRFQQNASCAFNTDYDRDGVANYLDNCPLDRNSSQIDRDGDGKGDVCDDDIDGDGVLNPLGLINAYGFFDYTTYRNNSGLYRDNCPLDVNPDQSNSNNNMLGDACDAIIAGGGLGIQSNGNTKEPSTITFEAISEGLPCSNSGYYRTFSNGKRFIGKKIQDIFNAGRIDVGLVDCNNLIAYTSIIITKETQYNTYKDYSLQIKANPSNGNNGFTSILTPEYSGDCEQILWSIDNKEILQTKNKNTAALTISGGGIHTIQAFCTVQNNTIIKAVAQTTLHVNTTKTAANEISAQLTADKTTTNIGTPIRFSTQINKFQEKDIANIYRDYGDETTTNNTSLKTIHLYDNLGIKIVRQIITHKNGSSIENIIQLKITNTTNNGNDDKGFIANLTTNPKVTKTLSDVTFAITSKQSAQIQNIQWDFGDGIYEQTNNLTTKHKYTQAGSYHTTANIILKNGNQVQYGDQISVYEEDRCLQYTNKNTNTNKNMCDLDNDKIPDICDTDIDGDGVNNPSGILLFDNTDCSIDSGNINPTIVQDPMPDIDNCPFTKNNKQENKDNDAFGDICDKQPELPNTSPSPTADKDNDGIPNKDDPEEKDMDHDGIPDHLDIFINTPIHTLPTQKNPITPESPKYKPPYTIPETPTIGGDPYTEPTIKNNCTACPCGFTQVISPIADGDIIYGSMLYDGGIIKSNDFMVK